MYLLLFASAYFLMQRAAAGNFTQPLTSTDALYFSVTVFTTVSFGGITAESETARVVLMIQMLADLALLGVGARVLLGRCTAASNDDPAPATAMARPPREDLPRTRAPAGSSRVPLDHRPGVQATRQGRHQHAPDPGADGAIPTMRQRRRPTPGRAAHHLPNPPWARTAIEDLLAGLPARATCLLAGALMPRLISAFVATPHPGPAIGPARHPAGLTKAQPCGGSTRSRSPVIVRSM